MNITLFGGSFNPPHLGHLIVIQQSFELINNQDQLWILPAYKHTFQKNLAPVNHRLTMCQLLLQDINGNIQSKVKVETIETDNQLSGETYEALKLLKKKYPTHNFSFLMGSDQLKSFTKWGNWQKLISILPFYIYPRSGYRNHISYPNMTPLQSPTQAITNLSSTLIRHRLKKDLPITHLVPKSIANNIHNNSLY